MKKSFRKVIKIILVVFILLFITLGIIVLRMSFRKTNEEIKATFKEKNIPVKIDSYSYNNGELRYMTTGKESADTAIVFVHGAPGGMDMFNSTMMDKELREKFLLVSVDRPGYGYSNSGESNVCIHSQGEIINQLIENQLSDKTIVLFGHSFGGPIVSYIAYLNPNVSHTILAGGAVDADSERFVWAAQLANFPLFKWIASKDTKVSSDEKITHQKELQAIEFIWTKIHGKIIVMHGTKDWLVPYSNAEFLEKKVPKNKLIMKTLEGESHFFIGNQDLLKSLFFEITNP